MTSGYCSNRLPRSEPDLGLCEIAESQTVLPFDCPPDRWVPRPVPNSLDLTWETPIVDLLLTFVLCTCRN